MKFFPLQYESSKTLLIEFDCGDYGLISVSLPSRADFWIDDYRILPGISGVDEVSVFEGNDTLRFKNSYDQCPVPFYGFQEGQFLAIWY